MVLLDLGIALGEALVDAGFIRSKRREWLPLPRLMLRNRRPFVGFLVDADAPERRRGIRPLTGRQL